VRHKFPNRDESWARKDNRNANEARFPARGVEPHSLWWSLNQLIAGGKSSIFGMSIKASPQCGRVIRHAMRSSSRSRGKPSAFRLSPSRPSALYASTLPGESWRTLLQTFRTKVFLALSDDFSTRTASDLCGKEEPQKLSYSLSEKRSARYRIRIVGVPRATHPMAAGKNASVVRVWHFGSTQILCA
jgi:hypothetical protein